MNGKNQQDVKNFEIIEEENIGKELTDEQLEQAAGAGDIDIAIKNQPVNLDNLELLGIMVAPL